MIRRKEITASTNLDARVGAPGDVFVAEFQTAGRGRLDHEWHSERSQNLMFSMVLDVGKKTPTEIATLPLVVGLAIASSLATVCPQSANLQPSLKWPNDILIDGRKICGILCERADDRVIAGIGVNVNQVQFAPHIAARATSLALILDHAVDREAILQQMIASVQDYHARWMVQGFESLYPMLCMFDALRNRIVSVAATDGDSQPITGRCGGIQPDGSLLIGQTHVYAGEAHVMGWQDDENTVRG